VHCSFH